MELPPGFQERLTKMISTREEQEEAVRRERESREEKEVLLQGVQKKILLLEQQSQALQEKTCRITGQTLQAKLDAEDASSRILSLLRSVQEQERVIRATRSEAEEKRGIYERASKETRGYEAAKREEMQGWEREVATAIARRNRAADAVAEAEKERRQGLDQVVAEVRTAEAAVRDSQQLLGQLKEEEEKLQAERAALGKRVEEVRRKREEEARHLAEAGQRKRQSIEEARKEKGKVEAQVDEAARRRHLLDRELEELKRRADERRRLLQQI
ncbi:hypothetical protein CBR_g30504 [Chara braunii]|uniref:Uncharacterized protein n=1 Tax=Chara braunii TaxID=69332 RepID=A0A388LCW9_CHABU|nr:hypothetical protein CBR_g30504 [Chara braunii]|eukprot:GBG80136.1 hypothetical protein CBR_g30504 [Chara braunii]